MIFAIVLACGLNFRPFGSQLDLWLQFSAFQASTLSKSTTTLTTLAHIYQPRLYFKIATFTAHDDKNRRFLGLYCISVNSILLLNFRSLPQLDSSSLPTLWALQYPRVVHHFCHTVILSVCLSYGRNYNSILMNFCTVIRGPKRKVEFVWDKNMITLSHILPPISKKILHYGLWRLQGGITQSRKR